MKQKCERSQNAVSGKVPIYWTIIYQLKALFSNNLTVAVGVVNLSLDDYAF